MSRRASLPGAAELFRTTLDVQREAAPEPAVAASPQPPRRSGPSGRERHDEKITVYCSAQELLDLESARLRLRAEHGIAVDRGRIVREALAVLLADMEANGAESLLVGRLRRL